MIDKTMYVLQNILKVSQDGPVVKIYLSGAQFPDTITFPSEDDAVLFTETIEAKLAVVVFMVSI